MSCMLEINQFALSDRAANIYSWSTEIGQHRLLKSDQGLTVVKHNVWTFLNQSYLIVNKINKGQID